MKISRQSSSQPSKRRRPKNESRISISRAAADPPKPSTRLSGTDELPSVAANRGVEPKKLSGLVRGELDWIVMKALDKDRSRRYETANGLVMDIQRYLSDEPVQASPPSTAYRFRKFARRNRVALSTAGLVAAALVLGTVVSIWQAIRATNAETTARSEARRASREAENARAQEKRATENLILANTEKQRAEDALEQVRAEQARAEGNLDLALKAPKPPSSPRAPVCSGDFAQNSAACLLK